MLEAERMRVLIARLRHERYGRSSEKLAAEVAQLELGLDELLIDIGGEDDAGEESPPPVAGPPPVRTSRARHPIPSHLPRRVGEDVTEILEYRPGQFEVVRHVRPAFSCRRCERMTQAPMPGLPIERSRPGRGLLAHVLVAKYCDHLPLYRQSEIHARDGVDLSRGLLASWVGKVADLVAPLVAAIGRHTLSGARLSADDTPVPLLSLGRGSTATGRMWAYLRDDRPFAGPDPPAVLYEFTPDRRGVHPQTRLREFGGILQADGYAGFSPLYASGRVVEAACWSHARRKFHDVLLAIGSPIAREAIERIGAL